MIVITKGGVTLTVEGIQPCDKTHLDAILFLTGRLQKNSMYVVFLAEA